MRAAPRRSRSVKASPHSPAVSSAASSPGSYGVSDEESRYTGSSTSSPSILPYSPDKARSRKRGCLRCAILTIAIFVILAVVAGVLVKMKILWFTMPKLRYETDDSNFKLTQAGNTFLTRMNFTLSVTMENPNAYPLRFGDVGLSIYDFRDVYIGTASHEATVSVPAHKFQSFTLRGVINTCEEEVTLISENCGQNGDTTAVKANGTLRAQIIPKLISYPVKLGPFKTRVKCQVNAA